MEPIKKKKKRKEILPFATTWMDIEGIMLSEISQTEKRQILYNLTYVWNLKTQTHRNRELWSLPEWKVGDG